jgi:hypothetical protein
MKNQLSLDLSEPLAFPLLTAAEVGRELLGGVPAKTVNLYAREGRLPCVWVGKHRRFNRPSVERALAQAARSGRRL